MRARSIAFEAVKLAVVKLVVIGDEYVDALLFGRKLDYHIVSNIKETINIIDSFCPDIVIFDLLDFPEIDFNKLHKKFMTVSVSPIFNCLEKTNLVFHRTRSTSPDWKSIQFEGELRCDLKYAVVREQCIKINTNDYEKNLEDNPLAVAISMGGTDANNKTLKLLEILKDIPCPILFWVLLGEGYNHSYEVLVDCVKKDTVHEIILAKTNDSMWRVLNGCAVAILAGGTITYEAAFAGIPSINIFEMQQQVFLIEELVKRGACISTGKTLDESGEVLIDKLTKFDRNRKELHEMHLNCKGLIDGEGAKRIATETLDYFNKKYQSV